MELTPIRFENNKLYLLDQRRLPQEEVWLEYSDYRDVAKAIKDMIVRGAPAIGITAAYGVALAKLKKENMDEAYKILAATRPTAVNLFWAIERMKKNGAFVEEAKRIHAEDIEMNKRIGEFGATLIKKGDSILTHCNAGALATGGYGTALGVIRSACSQGKQIKMYVDETRPYLQGSRLTAWELLKDGIDTTLICDNMAGFLMKQGKITKVIVGADRIAKNGDTANKIGTYSVAVLAKRNNVPFYVAAPSSTIDSKCKNGSEIVIEQRSREEVIKCGDSYVAPKDVKVENPAFDVTEAELISAIITDKGVFYSPYNFRGVRDKR